MKINFNTIKFNKINNSRLNQTTPLLDYNTNPIKNYELKKYNPAYNLAFKGFSCAPSSFQVKDIKNLRCPVCGLIMLDTNQISEFVKKVSDKKGEELISALQAYEDESYITGTNTTDKKKSIFRPQKQQIVNVVKKLAKQNPDLNLAQLVRLQAKVYLNNLISIQLDIIKELETYVIENVADVDELSNIKSIIEKYKKQILGESEEEFARKKFMYSLLNVVDDKDIQKEINRIAAKLPNSDNDINSFFVKYSKGYNSIDIAKRFICQTIPTTEHLIPQSTGRDNGYNLLFINSSANYICDCSECNTARGVLPFNEWMKNIPNFSQNLQQYLEDIQSALDMGILDEKYSEYIDDIIKKINKLSEGTIVLVKPKYETAPLKNSEISRRTRIIDDIKAKLTQLSDKKKELKNEIELLEGHPQFKRIIQHQKLTQRAEQLKFLIEKLKKSDGGNAVEIKNLEEELFNLEKTIKIIEAVVPTCEGIKEKINKKTKLIKEASKLDSQITKLRNSISDEIELKQRLADLKAEKSRIMDALSKSEDIESDEINKNENVKRYNHLNELLMRSAEMYENLSLMPSKNETIDKEILTIAQIAMHNQILELMEIPVVKKYTENKKLAEIKESEEKIKKRLQEIERTEAMISELVVQIKKITQGETLKELENDIEMLKVDLHQIEQIKNIQNLRAEHEALGDLIDYNYSVLNELKVYKKISSDEFEELIGQFYIK